MTSEGNLAGPGVSADFFDVANGRRPGYARRWYEPLSAFVLAGYLHV